MSDFINQPPLHDAAERTASPGGGQAPEGWTALVSELCVSKLRPSLAFWCGLLGFAVAYDRPAARFAYLAKGPLQIMLCERNGSSETGDLGRPFGRGINLRMRIDSIAPVLVSLKGAAWPLHEAPADAWYRVGDQERGQREFLVQDRDAIRRGSRRAWEPGHPRPNDALIATTLAPNPPMR